MGQEYTQLHPDVLQDMGLAGAIQMDGEFTGASPNLNRTPLHLSNSNQQGQMYGNARPIPVSPSMPHSAQHMSQRTSIDEVGGSPIVRLPSITRQGLILDGGIPIAPGLQQMTEGELEQHANQEASEHGKSLQQGFAHGRLD